MLEKAIQKLAKYRTNPDLWTELAWKEQEMAEDYWDENEENRTLVLLALQFEKQPADEELIRYLLAEETKNRANDPLQGGSNILNRAGYLLASFRNPENLSYFLDAKEANFDTHCGFDWEHILSAGVQKTFAQVEYLEVENQGTFYSFFESLDTCLLSENDIEKWLEKKDKGWYPNSFQNLNMETKIDLAFELNEKASAKKLVDEFEAKMGHNQESLQSLRYYRGQLGDTIEEIKIAEELLSFSKDIDLRAYDFVRISELYLKVGDPEKAWQTISKAIALKRRLDKGRLGQVADACIAIINTSEFYYDFFPKCYRFAKKHLGYFQSPQQIQNRVLAAERMSNLKK